MIPFPFQLQNKDTDVVWLYEKDEYSWNRAQPPREYHFDEYREKEPNEHVHFEKFVALLAIQISYMYECTGCYSMRKGDFKGAFSAENILEISFGGHLINSSDQLNIALKTIYQNKSLGKPESTFQLRLDMDLIPLQSIESEEEKIMSRWVNKLNFYNTRLQQVLLHHSKGYKQATAMGKPGEKPSIVSDWACMMHNLNVPFLNTIIDRLLKMQENKFIELMLFDEARNDWDLANVIERVINRHNSKGSYCLILPRALFLTLVSANTTIRVHKLSFLCHGGAASRPEFSPDDLKILAHAARLMPELKIIVLRQCFASGDFASDVKINPVFFKPRQIQIISKNAVIEQETLEPNEFLFQQVKEGEIIVTRIKYFDIQGHLRTRELLDIPLNSTPPRVSIEVEAALIRIAKEHHLPPLRLLEHANKIEVIKRKWKKNEILSEEERTLYKASDAKASTYPVKAFPPGNAGSYLAEKLYEERKKVSIKAYFSYYQTYFPRAGLMNSATHAAKERPKALRLDFS